jgi:WD40 repeat protein
MKQLISIHRELVLLGLQNKGFLMNRTISSAGVAILELSQSAINDNVIEPTRKDQTALDDVTAVAVTTFVVPGTLKSITFCAVARYNKTLSIYAIQQEDWSIMTSTSSACSPTNKLPSMVYHSPKRISCLTFARLPAAGTEIGNDYVQVLISGDLVGDSYAYNVLEKGERLLLGHTASMLTGVAMLEGEQKYCIATADRDEKIRISRFPETYIVEGYLLGHTKYVTAIDAVSTNELILLVSCGGDKMVRLWECSTTKELCSISTANYLDTTPSDIAISASGRMVAVLFDESKVLQFYQVLEEDKEDKFKMVPCQTVECPNVPLVISFDQSIDGWLILMREPECMMYIKVDEKLGSVTSMEKDGVVLESWRTLVANRSITLPNSIIEKDKQGNPVLQKEVETRGASAEEVPWKRPERIATAKEKQKNRRRNRREKNKQRRTEKGNVTVDDTSTNL